MYIYVCQNTYRYESTYIYIYIKRERERERDIFIWRERGGRAGSRSPPRSMLPCQSLSGQLCSGSQLLSSLG